MPKRTNFAAQSAAAARAAQQELAQLRKSLKAAQDGIAGLKRSLHVPVPKGGRRSTPASRSRPSFLDNLVMSAAGNFTAGGILFESDVSSRLGSSFGSFYTSSAQQASSWADMLQQAQRVM
jgi:hypothetical protein